MLKKAHAAYKYCTQLTPDISAMDSAACIITAKTVIKLNPPRSIKHMAPIRKLHIPNIQNYKFCDFQLPLHAPVKINERLLFFRRIGSLFWSCVRLTACFLFFLAGFILGAGRHIVFVILFSGQSVRMLHLTNICYTACFYLNPAGCLLCPLFYLKFTLPCAAVCLDILIECQLPSHGRNYRPLRP